MRCRLTTFSNVDKTEIFSEISGNFKKEAKQINFIKNVFSAAAAELWFRLLLTADWLMALNNKPGKIQIAKRILRLWQNFFGNWTRNWTRINTRWLWISRLQVGGRKKRIICSSPGRSQSWRDRQANKNPIRDRNRDHFDFCGFRTGL